MTNPKLHTAEHILWQALKNRIGKLKTRALQFTDDYCRFDFIADNELTQKDLEEINKVVNEIIKKNLEVKIEIVPREGAKEVVDLSLIPKNVEQVRMVKIGDFNVEACAGQHVKNTAEIGKIRLTEYKKIGKNTFRIKFILEKI